MGDKSHWEEVYSRKAPTEVSWFQECAAVSLDLIRRADIDRHAPVVDVGGGASRLVDDLLANGFDDVTVLDLSGAALLASQERLGAPAASVTWIEADITSADLPRAHYALWHDRAVFHFLTQEVDRQKYVAQLERSLRSDGQVVMATFAPDGPLRCSGLEVMRYSPESLLRELGGGFDLVESVRETHRTPFETDQHFTYCRFAKQGMNVRGQVQRNTV